MVYRTAVKIGVIFADAKNKERAKEFVSFLLQEENLTPYVEGALGRWFPVTKAAQESAVLAGRPAPQVGATTSITAGTVTFEFTKNYKFTILNNENVWAKAMNRVVNEKVPVDKAVDEMIARIKAGRRLEQSRHRGRPALRRRPDASRAGRSMSTHRALRRSRRRRRSGGAARGSDCRRGRSGALS